MHQKTIKLSKKRGELLKLKPQDILSDRMLLPIKQAKGKKDRMVPLSEKLVSMLRDYYKGYKPQVWLFEGQKSGNAYSERSLELVFKQALRNLLRCIGCGIARRRTYWKVVPTFAIFKSCWGIKAVRPQKYTPMSVHYSSKK